MEEMDKLLAGQLEKSLDEIENRVAWFYAYFLSEPPPEGVDGGMISVVSKILFPRDYRALPPARGPREAAARGWDVLLKKDFLRVQLRDIVDTYAGMLRMRGAGQPAHIRERLEERLDKFSDETGDALWEEVQRCFLRGFPMLTTAGNMQDIFREAAKGVNGYAAYCYEQAGWYRAMEALAAQGYSFLFVAEVGPTTCERCLANNGKVYPFEEVVSRELNPPLHFHCRCTLVPVKPGEGGAGETPGDNQSLEGSEKPWCAPFLPLLPYLKNLAGVPGEFWEMVRGFQQAQQRRWEERQILDLASLGLVSGFWEGMEGRAQTVLESPSIYNVANWLSMGLLDLGKGAINPEKPLSLEHWLDSLGFASALYGMYETGKRAAALHMPISDDRFKLQRVDWESEIPRDGEEWYKYLTEKYGSDNVFWKPNLLEDIIQNPRKLYGVTQREIANILGEGWTAGHYGITGTGWKFTKGDVMVFYHSGGKHGGSYYGFSSSATGKLKIVGDDYIPLPGDKATIVYYKENK